ncbi:MAG: DUF1638 domain-containing protein [Actinomycetota bacterium]
MIDIKNKKVAFIVCDVIYDEVRQKVPSRWKVISLEKKLHERSDELRDRLQKEIDSHQDYDVIILGYALCGKGTEGLVSNNTYLVLSKCDDCIAMLLGSAKEYKRQHRLEPGTYYLTQGYIGDCDDFIIESFSQVRDKYDDKTWDWIRQQMLKNYKRLVFINTGNYEGGSFREKAKQEAQKLGLRFEEIKGTNEYFDKMLNGEFDADFVVLKPGQKISSEMFFNVN